MKTNEAINISDATLKEIISGKYRDMYLVYNRKSTDDADNQKNSIKYQKAVNIRFSFDKKLPIAKLTLQGFCTDGIISERHSAFKEDELIEILDGKVTFRIERPKFQLLVEYLLKGYFKGVIFLCWDRASRNDGDGLVIKRLVKMGSDLHFSLTEYAKSSSGILHQDVDGMFAKYVSQVTSEKVKISTRNNRDNGVCTYKAPVGYMNIGEMENKPIDPIRAPIITRMFELYATGEWSLHALAKWANDQGFTMPPVKRRRTDEEILAEEEDDIRLEIEAICRPVVYTQVGRILENRFYIGEVKGNISGEWVPSISHKGIVEPEVFDAVQEVLKKKQVSQHYKDVLDTLYRGLFRCAECRRVYTPYEQKGAIYMRARCKSGCVNTKNNLTTKEAEDIAGSLIKNLSFTEEELIEMNASTKTQIASLEIRRSKEIDAIERRKKKLREDLCYLRTNKLTLLKTSAYTPEDYLAEEKSVQQELNSLMMKEQVSEEAMSAVVKDVIQLSELVQNAYMYYEKAESPEKEEIVRKIFSELTYSKKGNQTKKAHFK
jgi:hypothetical protein